MFQRIFVPLDGTKGAEQAIPIAAQLARTSGGSLVLVHVVLPPVEFGTYTPKRTIALKPGAFEERVEEAEKYLVDTATAHADELAGIEDIALEVVAGAAAPSIFSAARWEDVDLIVLCSHGESGLKRWMFGSIAHEAVRHSPVPVLVLNEHGFVATPSEATHSLRALVALDGSPRAEMAIAPAAHLLSLLAEQGELHLLRVVDIPAEGGKLGRPFPSHDMIREEAKQEAEVYLKEVTERFQEGLAAFKITITSSAVVSSKGVAETIVQQAEPGTEVQKADSYVLIALATHGRHGLRRKIMGSVTEHLLGATKLPLLIVRPYATEADAQKVEDENVSFEIAQTEMIQIQS